VTIVLATREPMESAVARSKTPVRETASTRHQLRELVLHLYQIQSAVVVSAAALRRQNCELDVDIANVLQRSVVDRIQDQIELIEANFGATPTLEPAGPAPAA
jgi:hypothetical protein